MESPTFVNGNPLVQVGISATEKINLELIDPNLKFSNTEIGTWATTWCEDTPEGREAARNELTAEIARYMEDERQQLVDDLTNKS